MPQVTERSLTASAIMRREVLTVQASASVNVVWAAMCDAGSGLALVLRGGDWVGLVGQQELGIACGLALVPPRQRSVASLVRPVPAVAPDTGLPEVCHALLRSPVGAAVVVDEDRRVLGVVTVDGVLAALAEDSPC